MKKVLYLLAGLLFASSGYSQTAQEYFNRAGAKYELKDYKGAIVDYTKAIEIEPRFTSTYFNRGLLKIKLGQKKADV